MIESKVYINGFNGRLDIIEERFGKLDVRLIIDIQIKVQINRKYRKNMYGV